MMYCYASELEIILKHKIIPCRFNSGNSAVFIVSSNKSFLQQGEFSSKGKFWSLFQILSNFLISAVII